MEYCPYRTKNRVGQYLCDISNYHLGKTKCCQQISEEICTRMRNREIEWHLLMKQAEQMEGKV